MRIGDVMTGEVVRCHSAESLSDAARKMSAAGVGLLVVFEGGHVAGVVTDRDIVVRALAQGMGPSAQVRAAMTSQVITCEEDQPLADAGKLMEAHAVRRLLVVDADGGPVGVISIDDLASVGDARLAEELAHIAHPAPPDGLSG